MSSGEIYNGMLPCLLVESRRCVHLTGDIINAQARSEARSSWMTVEEGAVSSVIVITIRSNLSPTPHTNLHVYIKQGKPAQAGCGQAVSNWQHCLAGSEDKICTFAHKITP